MHINKGSDDAVKLDFLMASIGKELKDEYFPITHDTKGEGVETVHRFYSVEVIGEIDSDKKVIKEPISRKNIHIHRGSFSAVVVS